MNALAKCFDWFYAETRLALLDRILVYVSISTFMLHLLMVALANVLRDPPPVIAAVGKNYLSAIYTPFSFILFYEVFLLIIALPKSTTQSIAKQFEIVSLIFVRHFFKDIASLGDIGKLAKPSPEVLEMFLNVLAGLFMFLLVTVFLHTARKTLRSVNRIQESAELQLFIAQKKIIALVLTVALVSLAVYSLVAYLNDYSQVVYRGAAQKFDPNTIFYSELFTIMIFADVLILILSLALFDKKYEFVFRNVAFVISTILIRFSLTSAREYSAALAIGGMLFGLFTLLIYNYNLRMQAIST
jgi:hypothetical protein